MRIALIILLTFYAFVTGYVVGYNVGYDDGKVIGKLDAKFHFQHNGVDE